jgi:septal ring factor EnvC (AmiA/AmiB activator)
MTTNTVPPVTPPATPGTPDPSKATNGETPQTWESYLESLSAELQTLYTAHTEGLMNTVKATRTERDQFKAELKKLSKSADDGSDLKKQLEAMETTLEQTERKATFMEEAIKPAVACRNPKAAFLLAEAESLYDKRGNPDWAAIKVAAPELFGIVLANANAGNGTQNSPAPANNMNNFIRTAAGRK